MSATAIVRVLLSDMPMAASQTIKEALHGARDMTVVGEIGAGDDIVATVRRLRPNLVLVGIGGRARDPFEATKTLMAEAPTPIVIIADGQAGGDVQASVLALRSGALAVMALPSGAAAADADGAHTRFVSSLKALSEVKLVRRWREKAPVNTRPTAREASELKPSRLIAIAASTGGPAALQRVLSDLPPDFEIPILVVQHMAQGFTDGLAQWLNTVCSLTVKVAAPGEPLKPRTVYLAPDKHHLGVSSQSTIALSAASPVNGFRPAADHLFELAARGFGAGLTVVVLTGMGQDGVIGLRTVRQLGGQVIAQDELSCVVYGMPKAACDAGLVDDVLPLSSIASRLIEIVEERSNGGGR